MKLKDHNIRLDLSAISRNRYNRARDTMPELIEAEEAVGTMLGSGAPYLTRDLWSSFYAPDTAVDGSTTGGNLHRLAEYIVKTVNDAGTLSAVRDRTEGSTISSLEACYAALEVLKAMPLPDPPNEESQVTITNENGTCQKLSASEGKVTVTMTSPSGSTISRTIAAKDGDTGHSLMDGILQKQLQNGYKITDSRTVDEAFDLRLANALDAIEADQVLASKLRLVAADKFQEALTEIEAAETAFAMAYGREGGKDASRNATVEDLELIKRLDTPGLRDFVQRIGRFLDAFGAAQIADSVRGLFVVDGVALTDQVSRLTPTELAMFTMPSLRAHQTSRLVAKQTFGYRKSQLGAKQSGPFLVSLDISESMGWPDKDWPTPAAYAAAAALAAAEEGRQVSFVTFNGVTEAVEADLDSAIGRVNFIQRLMRIKPRYGTDFRGTVDEAAKLPADADVLLISDGDGLLNEELARSVFSSRRLHYLVIGSAAQQNSVLRDIAGDRAVTVNDLTDSGAAIIAASAVINR